MTVITDWDTYYRIMDDLDKWYELYEDMTPEGKKDYDEQRQDAIRFEKENSKKPNQ